MQLDHLVVAVPDLDAAIAEFAEATGIEPRPGGRHEGLGTHNAILPLEGATYVELIAADPTRPPPAQARPFGLDGLEDTRLVTFAVRSRDIEADVARARSLGYDPGLIVPVERALPGGGRIRWRLTLKREPMGDGLVPFVIDWGDAPHPTATAGARARCVGLAAAHPDPKPIRVALHALGFDLDVAFGGKPMLAAQIRGPSGLVDVRS